MYVAFLVILEKIDPIKWVSTLPVFSCKWCKLRIPKNNQWMGTHVFLIFVVLLSLGVTAGTHVNECFVHWDMNKIIAIFEYILFNESFVFYLRFQLSLFLEVHLKKNQHWFCLWLGGEQTTSCYLNYWWPTLLMPFYQRPVLASGYCPCPCPSVRPSPSLSTR